MQKVFLIFSLSLLLFSCTQTQDKEKKVDIVKKDFFITTKKISDFWNSSFIYKTWKILPSEYININSQVSGRIQKINFNEWQKVQKGDILVELDDNIWNYYNNVIKIKNSISKAKLNYKSINNTFNKNINNLEIKINNNKIDENNSKSSVELDKIKKSLNKLVLDYEKLKISNKTIYNNFKSNIKLDYDKLNIFMNDVIEFSDEILSITELNKNTNKNFKQYLWVHDLIQKRKTEDLLRWLLKYKKEINFININNNDNFDENIEKINGWYNEIYTFLKELNILIDNSLNSVWTFPESLTDSYKGKIDIFLSTYSINNGIFVNLMNSINTFLETYNYNEELLYKQILIIENDMKLYIKWLDITLKADLNNLDELKQNKILNLDQVNESINDLELAYDEAINNYNKLNIKSSISGILDTKYIDIGVELQKWSKVARIYNDKRFEIVVYFNNQEIIDHKIWDKLEISYNNIFFTWTINTISNISDDNFKYKTTLITDYKLEFIWDLVSIKIPQKTNFLLLPLEILKIYWNNKAEIYIYKNNKIQKKVIKIWKIYWSNIEVLDNLNQDIQIIINDIENYDKNKFKIKIKN